MKKLCNTVLLSTDGKTNMYKFKETNNLILSNHPDQKNEAEPQHLYILSDDEIKEGDWYYATDTHVIGIAQFSDLDRIFDGPFGFTYKRIIGSTDRSLNLPSPELLFIRYFIRQYNIGSLITKVMVEYEIKGWAKELVEYAHEPSELHKTLKLEPDNTIRISLVKELWSREEVIQLLHQYDLSGCSDSNIEFTEWIASNL